MAIQCTVGCMHTNVRCYANRCISNYIQHQSSILCSYANIWLDAITAYFCAAFSRLAAAAVAGLYSPIVSLELAFGIITTK
jgi:hypothetical protein